MIEILIKSYIFLSLIFKSKIYIGRTLLKYLIKNLKNNFN